MSRKRNSRSRKRTNRVYFFVIAAFVVIVMTVQIVNLYQKNAAYAAEEIVLKNELEAQQEKQEELANYEKYIQTDEYKENIAQSKLGLVHENEIIFRENE
ncbi:MAG: septum formation initiator family protein [Lachnospiraceae bacterium]|nr:septum formation initiator family protein [Lachnospiraceae bacterium]